ncbi:MAG: hypothetical protein Q7T73_06820 [Beijerinckiaceae bacterium]|nr:hypothetical protein [Beijerinckiaceae bacterium]
MNGITEPRDIFKNAVINWSQRQLGTTDITLDLDKIKNGRVLRKMLATWDASHPDEETVYLTAGVDVAQGKRDEPEAPTATMTIDEWVSRYLHRTPSENIDRWGWGMHG